MGDGVEGRGAGGAGRGGLDSTTARSSRTMTRLNASNSRSSGLWWPKSRAPTTIIRVRSGDSGTQKTCMRSRRPGMKSRWSTIALGRRNSSQPPPSTPPTVPWTAKPCAWSASVSSIFERTVRRLRRPRPMVRRCTQGTCGMSSMFSIARVQWQRQSSTT